MIKRMKLQKKSIAIILVAALGFCLFIGTTSALRNPPPDPIQQVLQILLGIQPKITNIENKTNSLETGIQQLEPNSTSVYIRVLYKSLYQQQYIPLLPYESGKTYSGHYTLMAHSAGEHYRVDVRVGYNDVLSTTTTDGNAPVPMNVDFACETLGLYVMLVGENPTNGYVVIDGTIQYQTSTNVERMELDVGF